MQYIAAIFLALAAVAAAIAIGAGYGVANTLAWFVFAVFSGLTVSALWRWRHNRNEP